MILIYGKDGCKYCTASVEFCENNNYEFEYYKLGVDFQREDMIRTFPLAKSYPQIIITKEDSANLKIGGYDQLVQYYRGGNK